MPYDGTAEAGYKRGRQRNSRPVERPGFLFVRIGASNGAQGEYENHQPKQSAREGKFDVLLKLTGCY